MPWFRTHKKQRPGQPIVARDLRKLAETADFAARIRANPPLGISLFSGGPLISYLGQVFGAGIAITTSTISYRSGSTPGSGTAALQSWNGSIFQVLPNGTVTVFNISSNPTGIPNGKYCILLRIFGSWWIITAEC